MKTVSIVTMAVALAGAGAAVGPAPAYAPIASGSADVTPEWKLFNARGVAAADVPAGQAGVTLHLAAAKAVLDLGPVFVLDLGKTGPER
jgi:hypothetical protein